MSNTPIILILQFHFRSVVHLNTLPPRWFWDRAMGSLWTGGPWALSSMNFWLDVCLSLGTLQKSYLDKSSVVNIKSYLYITTGKQLLNVNRLCVTKMLTFIKHLSQQIKELAYPNTQLTLAFPREWCVLKLIWGSFVNMEFGNGLVVCSTSNCLLLYPKAIGMGFTNAFIVSWSSFS